ncbi:ATP-dependent helicase [Rhodococcus sp. MEB064]|uniref:ATP-dependent helicase n=1 Tax=Rhodococcus sp. MEB064 TaxID=1587522 RepID=UPI0005AC4B03|nr:ATP-dependent DNA helicase [Rhodococcus sp. MEB064]KIQ19627.1 ATP-dependent DNA helicase [Rhodococcus sp. MEB064]
MDKVGTDRAVTSATAGGGIRLVRRSSHREAPRRWPEDCAPLFGAGDGRPWQVLGGPGTGKTSLIADVAVARMTAAGSDPESVLVLTHSRQAAVDMREQITAGLLGADSAPRATREPLVRTVHSYAFAVLRLQASGYGNPPPRLLTNADQDSVIREMLRGEVEDGASRWPERVRPALGLVGFASELRDLILRAAERGLGPEDLVAWGRKHARPEWVAAGKFAAQYEQAMLLRGSVGVETPEATSPGLDAAELVGAALTAFATDPDLLVRERTRIRHVLVDDAQHLDPQAAQLIRLLAAGASSTVVAGDPDQAVFSFRGADARFLADLDDRMGARRIILSHNHRASAAVGSVAGAVASMLPGRVGHRVAGAYRDEPQGDGTDSDVVTRAVPPVRVVVASSTAKEAVAIADTFRRAHLADGVAWSDMAVVVRSVPRSLPPLRRALHAAGVPVVSSATALPLHRQRGAAALLLVMRAVAASRCAPERSQTVFSEDAALALVEGPIGAADPLAVRRLRRGLRRGDVGEGGDRDSSTLLRAAVIGDSVDEIVGRLSDVESAPLRRVRAVVSATAAAVGASGRRVEEALWAGWRATTLERRWVASSARGGPLGVQADRDLDSVVALFDAAASYVDSLPRGTLEGFVDHVTDQEIPVGDGRREAVTPDAVRVISAHAAVGRQWDVVAVAGVQEGLWPALRPRGSLLGVEALVDLAAGISDGGRDLEDRVSRTAPLLAEERRLFLVACSRARSSLLVTAVDSVTGGSDAVRSRFVDDMLASGLARHSVGDPSSDEVPAETPQGRVLALPALVAELRSVVCDRGVAEADPARHARAASHLARLAREGVRGAHPDEWYGVSGISTDEALWDPEDGPVSLSPSTVEVLTACPLRWALERSGGTDGDTVHAVTGTLVHTLVQAVAGRVPPDEVRRELEKAWVAVDLGSSWFSRKELARTATMIDTFQEWMSRSRGELTAVGVEVPVDGILPPRTPDEPPVHLRGRIDRLERDPDGRAVVIDVKTGKNPASAAATADHAQLATYQIALAAGAVEGEPAGDPGGGRLVYVAKGHRSTGATQRTQPPLSGETLEQWRDVVVDAARATRGPVFEARVNDGCRHCPIASSCPAQDKGRQVTEG